MFSGPVVFKIHWPVGPVSQAPEWLSLFELVFEIFPVVQGIDFLAFAKDMSSDCNLTLTVRG